MKTRVIELKETDSTNEYCKRLNVKESVIVIAGRQVSGKGTKGRSFSSEEGGLYLSLMKTYKNFDHSQTYKIMINACVAVCKTLEHFGIKPTVKWANDVLVNGRKICGTLIENSLNSGSGLTSIVGIGINVNNALPEELQKIATTMREERGKPYSLKAVSSKLIKNLEKEYTVGEYKSYIDWFGQEVFLDGGGVKTTAVALDVDESGNLVCNVAGEIKKISSAEMSLRLKCNSI